ncbi:MAG: hypothetical protein FD146_1605 [Anaerolineaceae bacterium]|nr:MAG: hypothetical protein FD146_1605 [Anaerolineaceae bacterium]
MNMVICPDCKMRVIPKADGSCPSCGAKLKGRARAAAPARVAPAADRRQPVATRPRARRKVLHYGEVLGRAWEIIWKFKILWLFGILSSCGGNYSSSSNSYRTTSGELPPGLQEWMERFTALLKNPGFVAGLVAVALIYLAAVVFLGYVGSIGLIRGGYQAERGAKQLKFGELFKGSLPYFWRVFGMNFLVIFILLVLLIVPMICMIGAANLLYPLFCVWAFVFIVLALGVGMVLTFATPAIVIENLGISKGWKRGWDLVLDNFGAILVMTLIMFAIGLGVGIVLIAPIVVALYPAVMAIQAGSTDLSQFNTAGIIVLIYLPVYLLVNGILTAYSWSVWTLTFLRLARPVRAKASNA